MPGPMTFAGGTLDRMANRRTDAAWIEAMRADERAVAVVAGRRGVVLETVALSDREPVALLGVREDGVPVWAVEPREDDALTDLRGAAPRLGDADAGLLAYAQGLLHWHRTNGFCSVCGQPTEPGEAGFSRACSEKHTSYPRTDPVVIMLVVDGDRALMGRQAAWPAGRYSALAGFVEPGESLEAAVAREVEEETSIAVGAVRYRASQPWPFPASLMMGFQAEYASGSPQADEDELEDVRWFTRDELEAAARKDDGQWLLLPPRIAIARRLVDAWLGDG